MFYGFFLQVSEQMNKKFSIFSHFSGVKLTSAPNSTFLSGSSINRREKRGCRFQTKSFYNVSFLNVAQHRGAKTTVYQHRRGTDALQRKEGRERIERALRLWGCLCGVTTEEVKVSPTFSCQASPKQRENRWPWPQRLDASVRCCTSRSEGNRTQATLGAAGEWQDAA